MVTEIAALILEIRTSLTDTFAAIDHWFDKDPVLRAYRPPSGGWTIDQVLEHIGLTNYFLLILIEKGTRKALQNAHGFDLQHELATYTFHRDQLTEVGLHQSFEWIRPEHMEPKGLRSIPEVRQQLQDQLHQCLSTLDLLKNGEGVLHKTTMTVNNLGKIDVYEYLYFLAQHGRRHMTQMEKNETAYKEGKQSVDDRLTKG